MTVEEARKEFEKVKDIPITTDEEREALSEALANLIYATTDNQQ